MVEKDDEPQEKGRLPLLRMSQDPRITYTNNIPPLCCSGRESSEYSNSSSRNDSLRNSSVAPVAGAAKSSPGHRSRQMTRSFTKKMVTGLKEVANIAKKSVSSPESRGSSRDLKIKG